ncbi:MAG TPA: response regulator [Chthoniobacteraceae bacterium]|jgi:DNA-binding response OmpR family regulator|nr:response regulator [Chthoniobacteraceae bacterium]
MFPPDGPASSPPAECRLHILLIEEHPLLAGNLCRFLERRRHLVHCAADFESARSLLAEHEFDVLLSNVEMPDGDCYELLDGSAERLPRFIVTMSDFDLPCGLLMAGGRELQHHLTKPFVVEELDGMLNAFASELARVDLVARHKAALPSMVEIVLREAARRHDCGDLSDGEFAEKLHRLTREELEKRGLELVVRPLDWGTRFLIKQAPAGRVCDMIDCALSKS